MSEIPKYAYVSLEERRRREAQERVAAEQRRLAAEAAARKQRLREEHARRVLAQKAEYTARVETVKAEHEAQLAATLQAAAEHQAESEARFAALAQSDAGTREPQAPARVTAAPAPPAWVPPLFERPAAIVERVLQQRAEAGTLIDATVADTTLSQTRAALVRADRALEQAFETGDDAAVDAAGAEAATALEAAQADHERLLELRERRRIIAKAIAEALPERYVIGQTRPIEDSEGRIYFSASAPNQTLEITITGDATGDVIGYKADGIDLEEHVEDGEVVADCPRFAEQLEALHEQLEPLGVHAGELHWQGAPRERHERARREHRQRSANR
jgi:hypothetical protein